MELLEKFLKLKELEKLLVYTLKIKDISRVMTPGNFYLFLILRLW